MNKLDSLRELLEAKVEEIGLLIPEKLHLKTQLHSLINKYTETLKAKHLQMTKPLTCWSNKQSGELAVRQFAQFATGQSLPLNANSNAKEEVSFIKESTSFDLKSESSFPQNSSILSNSFEEPDHNIISSAYGKIITMKKYSVDYFSQQEYNFIEAYTKNYQGILQFLSQSSLPQFSCNLMAIYKDKEKKRVVFQYSSEKGESKYSKLRKQGQNNFYKLITRGSKKDIYCFMASFAEILEVLNEIGLLISDISIDNLINFKNSWIQIDYQNIIFLKQVAQFEQLLQNTKNLIIAFDFLPQNSPQMKKLAYLRQFLTIGSKLSLKQRLEEIRMEMQRHYSDKFQRILHELLNSSLAVIQKAQIDKLKLMVSANKANYQQFIDQIQILFSEQMPLKCALGKKIMNFEQHFKSAHSTYPSPLVKYYEQKTTYLIQYVNLMKNNSSSSLYSLELIDGGFVSLDDCYEVSDIFQFQNAQKRKQQILSFLISMARAILELQAMEIFHPLLTCDLMKRRNSTYKLWDYTHALVIDNKNGHSFNSTASFIKRIIHSSSLFEQEDQKRDLIIGEILRQSKLTTNEEQIIQIVIRNLKASFAQAHRQQLQNIMQRIFEANNIQKQFAYQIKKHFSQNLSSFADELEKIIQNYNTSFCQTYQNQID